MIRSDKFSAAYILLRILEHQIIIPAIAVRNNAELIRRLPIEARLKHSINVQVGQNACMHRVFDHTSGHFDGPVEIWSQLAADHGAEWVGHPLELLELAGSLIPQRKRDAVQLAQLLHHQQLMADGNVHVFGPHFVILRPQIFHDQNVGAAVGVHSTCVHPGKGRKRLGIAELFCALKLNQSGQHRCVRIDLPLEHQCRYEGLLPFRRRWWRLVQQVQFAWFGSTGPQSYSKDFDGDEYAEKIVAVVRALVCLQLVVDEPLVGGDFVQNGFDVIRQHFSQSAFIGFGGGQRSRETFGQLDE